MAAGGINSGSALLQATAVAADEAWALPFAAYHDEALYALEVERLFRGDWGAVCAESALAEAGDYLALNIGGEPLVLIRSADGELRALSNVCRHRGTLMLDQGAHHLDQCMIVCPYHAWSYNGSRVFRAAPYSKGARVDPEERSLPAFRTEVWMGVVFVTLEDDALPLTERLSGIAPHLVEFDILT